MDQVSELKKIISDLHRKMKNRRWPCFYPQCNSPSIKSHSQPLSICLRKISEEGHVMERSSSIFPLREKQGWERIGIQKATIFPGFCKSHDNQLFKQADSINKNNLAPKALMFLSFRTFAMEMRKKDIYANHLNAILKRRDKFIDPNAEEGMRGAMEGMLNCLKVTRPPFLKHYQSMIKSKDYSLMTHKIYKADKNLGVSCATAINPLDIYEQPIHLPQPLICFNVLSRNQYTLVIFSYLKDCSALTEQFIRNNERLEDLIFNYCEEVILNISLYHSLDRKALDTIEMAQGSWMSWQKVDIPEIFNFKLDDYSFFRGFSG